MKNIFNSISVRRNKYNTFNLSFENKLSCNMGQLVPVMVQDVLPGDRFKVNTEQIIRLAPLSTPMMQRVDVYFHYFYVPLRLIWDDFEKFITGGVDGKQSPVSPFHEIYAGHKSLFNPGSLLDYLGYPSIDIPSPNCFNVDALPIRAYNLIYNNYYRDQNVPDDFAPVPKGSGFEQYTYEDENGDTQTCTLNELCQLRYRNWKKDYFTSALPFAQRGPAVQIPLVADNKLIFNPDGRTYTYVNGEEPTGNSPVELARGSFVDGDNQVVNIDNSQNLEVSSTWEDGTITDLRYAFKVQEWLERMARGGSRYIEQIKAFFGVNGDDYRLQRPIYLGGGKSPVVVSEVAQTSQTTSSSPQATLAGAGTNVSTNFAFNRSFKEHGFVMCIMSIMPKASYFQGVPRKYLRRDKFDYFWPQFAHIGEQPIYNQELFAQATPHGIYDSDGLVEDNVNNETFGYTPRYAEYRFNHDEVHGEFRDTLDNWHMARKFANLPTLNSEFLQCDDSSSYRPFAVTDDTVEHFYCQIYHKIIATRQIPRYGSPSL